MPGLTRSLASTLLMAMLLSQGGCVALNIPSQRLHDPNDNGGMFGHWKTEHCQNASTSTQSCTSGQSCPSGQPCSSGQACASGQTCVSGPTGPSVGACSCCNQQEPCLDGGPLLDEDPLNQNGPQPAEPEIPWPRFHPVPVRPLFSGTVGS